MISFEPTEQQEQTRVSAREFALQKLRPTSRDCDEAGSIPSELLQEVRRFGQDAADDSALTEVLVLEELAYGDAAGALAACRGLAWIEPIPVFEPLKIRTEARRRGDGWVLSGQKCCVPLGEPADEILVVAETGAGLGAFAVRPQAAGLTISPPEKKLGLKALTTYGLNFDEVEAEPAESLGGVSDFDPHRLLARSRVICAGTLVGLSRAVLDLTIPYAKERVAFGEAIAQKQTVAFLLAEMRIEIDAMRWLIWKAASELDKGASHHQEALRSARLAYSYAAERAMKIADDGVQILGGHGYVRRHLTELWYRNARTVGVLEAAVGA